MRGWATETGLGYGDWTGLWRRGWVTETECQYQAGMDISRTQHYELCKLWGPCTSLTSFSLPSPDSSAALPEALFHAQVAGVV